VSHPKSIIQYAALPYRVVDGHVEVMLVTSRETKRWILPKGQPEKRLKPYEVAAAEAFEEAGIVGTIDKDALTAFPSTKRLKNGTELPCTIKVYVLKVKKVLDEWPEKSERERRWFSPGEAAMVATEAGLIRTLLDFGAKWL
jgi:8-oxo-dGTP pyrophosphatase MutT (NUDIX family)